VAQSDRRDTADSRHLGLVARESILNRVGSCLRPASGHARLMSQNNNGRTSTIDGRTTLHTSYAISQRIRKNLEEGLAWIKTVAGQEQTRCGGGERVGFAAPAYNLARLPKLMTTAT
jgi:hypothetical protein